jgi:hypothetical protein
VDKDAFTLGVKAAKEYKSIYDCPYTKAKQPYAFRQWFAGYDSAKRLMEKMNG